jgi:hypothetical protein
MTVLPLMGALAVSIAVIGTSPSQKTPSISPSNKLSTGVPKSDGSNTSQQSAVADAGILPPDNPPANILPSPNFLAPGTCSGGDYDNSATCTNSALAAINNARSIEGLSAMTLPANWYSLSPQQQQYVATNLERSVRGLPELSGMVPTLDAVAATGAADAADPDLGTNQYPFTEWGSNWAGGVGNILEAMYLWMYDDGPGSSNVDCAIAGQQGCWGHRDNILMSMRCNPCVMGSGFDATGWDGNPSWAEILVDSYGAQNYDFTMAQVDTSTSAPVQPASVDPIPAADPPTAPVIGIAPTPDGKGYWMASADGNVYTFGDAQFFGSMYGHTLSSPISAIAATPDGLGYWLVGWDGGIFAFGDAQFFGSMGGHQLSEPVVGITPTSDGQGYWEVATDGGIFAFGDARFYGSMGGHSLNKPVVGITAAPGGNGYWEVASDGGLFAFGDAGFYGSTGGMKLDKPVVSMSATPNGQGYWLVASDGGIFAYGNAGFAGSTGGQNLAAPVVSIATPPTGTGYWLVASDGGVFAYGVPFEGSKG